MRGGYRPAACNQWIHQIHLLVARHHAMQLRASLGFAVGIFHALVELMKNALSAGDMKHDYWNPKIIATGQRGTIRLRRHCRRFDPRLADRQIQQRRNGRKNSVGVPHPQIITVVAERQTTQPCAKKTAGLV
jgi:hypothetical protein